MGQLSKVDMEREFEEDGLKIIPFVENCKKAASYDITPTIIAMSAKVGMLENVYREPHYNKDKYYILVHPKDTVLIVSNEYLIVPPNIAGYVSSRVSKLVEGFGHISTTIDPNWKGAALIALSNPSNQPLKVYVGASKEGEGSQNQLATITFHYLNTQCAIADIDGAYRGMRLDLLEKIMYTNKRGFKAFWRNVFYSRRKKFTDYFMSVCKEKYGDIDDKEWLEILDEFSYLDFSKLKEDNTNKYSSKKAKINARDFIITENILTRIVYFLQKKQDAIIKIFVIIILGLIALGIIPQNFLEYVITLIIEYR